MPLQAVVRDTETGLLHLKYLLDAKEWIANGGGRYVFEEQEPPSLNAPADRRKWTDPIGAFPGVIDETG